MGNNYISCNTAPFEKGRDHSCVFMFKYQAGNKCKALKKLVEVASKKNRPEKAKQNRSVSLDLISHVFRLHLQLFLFQMCLLVRWELQPSQRGRSLSNLKSRLDQGSWTMIPGLRGFTQKSYAESPSLTSGFSAIFSSIKVGFML